MRYKIESKQNLYKLILSIIFLLALFLRLYKIGATDLWFDEAFSVNMVRFGYYFSTEDLQPPLYYLLLNIWISIFGDTEFAVRSLSAFCSFGVVILSYIISKKIFSRNVAIYSTFITAISPFHIWYAQEARGYAIATFLIILALYFLIYALSSNKKIFWILFCFTSALSLYTNYIYIIIIFFQFSIFFSKKHRPLLKKWLICISVSFILFLPWTKIFISHLQGIISEMWVPDPNLKSLLITLENINIGYTGTKFLYILSLFFYICLFILGIFKGLNLNKEITLILVLLFLGPIIFLYGLSKIGIGVYLSRLFLPISPIYYIIIAVGLAKSTKYFRSFCFIVIVIITLLSIYNYYGNNLCPLYYRFGVHKKKPFEPVVKFVAERMKKKDIVACTSPSLAPSLRYYFFRNKFHYHGYYFMIPAYHDSYFKNELLKNSKTKHITTIILPKDWEDIKESGRRIWLISSSWERGGKLNNNSIAVRKWMKERANLIYEKWIDEILVGLYEFKE